MNQGEREERRRTKVTKSREGEKTEGWRGGSVRENEEKGREGKIRKKKSNKK